MSKKHFLVFALRAGVFLLVLLSLQSPANCAGDPRYNDIRGHWAEQYIRVLWEESVTDGYLPSVDSPTAKYRPDDFTTRAQLAVLLFKVFGLSPAYPRDPTYPDVPPHYHLFWNKPAWHLIEGAYAGGIMFVPPGHYFRPDDYITREDAVELLILSLGLAEYANSVSPSEQQAILRTFWDYRSVSEARRASMACAIRLGIIKGYDDGSIGPSLRMERGEAATVVARSCLIRMNARKAEFSPDGDGVDDMVTFDLSFLHNRGIASWQAAIEDSSGNIVRYLGSPGTKGQPPPTLQWDGRTAAGSEAPSGTYYYQALVTDKSDRQHVSVRRPLQLTRHTLEAQLIPTLCYDGQTLTVTAVTGPAAETVTATFADGVKRYMSPSSKKTHWQVAMTVGPFLPLGAQTVIVSATWSDASRSASLSFQRAVEMWVDPWIDPNPASWGQLLTLWCRTPSSVQTAEVTLFGEKLVMQKVGTGLWKGTSRVPWGVQPAQYPARFTVRSPVSGMSADVLLTVNGPDTSGLAYVLTK
ncbi:MAG: S-layer homology domain-containing protein [Bacillota bacterium]